MVENIEYKCNQSLDEIQQKIGTNEAIILEQNLWQTIQKLFKSNTNTNSILINYLVGFYNTLLEILFLKLSNDPFLNYYNNRNIINSTKNENNNFNDKLLYNIYLRIGDLYRYQDSRETAKLYYKRALSLDTKRGHSYYQLSLCTPLTNAYQCLYYSVRALHSLNESIVGAEMNIRLSIERFDSPLFERFRNKLNSNKKEIVKLMENSIKILNPKNGQEWFYLIIISIHFNDLNLTLNLLLDQLITFIDDNNDSNKLSIEFDYLLMSLDVAIDWILKDRKNQSNDTLINQSIDNLKMLNIWFNQKSTTTTTSDKQQQQYLNIGLLHNFILKDFKPLHSLYNGMNYFYETQYYHVDKHRKLLITRLILKLQQFHFIQ